MHVGKRFLLRLYSIYYYELELSSKTEKQFQQLGGLVHQLRSNRAECLLNGRQRGDHNQCDDKQHEDDQIDGEQTFAKAGVLQKTKWTIVRLDTMHSSAHVNINSPVRPFCAPWRCSGWAQCPTSGTC